MFLRAEASEGRWVVCGLEQVSVWFQWTPEVSTSVLNVNVSCFHPHDLLLLGHSPAFSPPIFHVVRQLSNIKTIISCLRLLSVLHQRIKAADPCLPSGSLPFLCSAARWNLSCLSTRSLPSAPCFLESHLLMLSFLLADCCSSWNT